MKDWTGFDETYRQLLQGGGEAAIKAQHQGGKLTARERIARLLDDGSFVETDVFLQDPGAAEAPADGVVAGFGTVAGRPVYLYAQDFTVLKGSIGRVNAAKVCKVMDLAVKTGVPIISLVDSAGARLKDGILALEGYGSIMARAAAASGVVPQIAVVMGPCIGAAALAVSMADFVIGVENTGMVLSRGADVLSAAFDVDVAKKASALNAEAGLVHFTYPDEDSALAAVKRLLDYLPDNNLEDAPLSCGQDDMNRIAPELNDYAQARDMDKVISAIVDGGEFLPCMAGFAPAMITGFARVNGRSVGIVANRPSVNQGAVDCAAANKAARFIAVCDAFSLPIVTLADTAGLPVDMGEEKAGLVRCAGRMAAAYAQASVPKVTVVTGQAIGSGWLLMGSRACGADMVFAWPEAVIASLEADTAAVILYDEQIAASDNPVAARAEYAARYAKEEGSALAAARAGAVDQIFLPQDTRPMVAAALEMLSAKREQRMPRKHAVAPV